MNAVSRAFAVFLAGVAFEAAVADVITAGDAAAWHDDFSDLGAWRAKADWQPNPDATATVTRDGDAAQFCVHGPDKGMKWSRGIAPVALSDAPYVYLRYRAVNVRTGADDYLVYVDDHAPQQECRPVRLRDVIADGQWHTVAADLRRVTQALIVDAVAVQVQTGPAERAQLWIRELGFAEAPPEDAEIIGGTSPEINEPDHALDVAGAAWKANPSWLGNPATQYEASLVQGHGAAMFRVDEPGRGMKWSTGFPQVVTLTGHRYLAMRYRAKNLGRYADYALCLLGNSADGSAYEEVIRGNDLQSDGQWHVAVAPLTGAAAKMSAANGMAVQVQAGGASAELCVDTVALTSSLPLTRFGDAIPFEERAQFDGFHPVDLGRACNQSLSPVLGALRLREYPADRAITALGVPFRLQQGGVVLAATGVKTRDCNPLSAPCECRCSQVFLLLFAVLRGQEEAVYGGGAFRRIADVDRFRVMLTYEDGTREACLPGNVATGLFEIRNGVQIVCAWADERKTLRSVTLCDATEQGGFAVAAMTCRTGGEPLFRHLDETRVPAPVKRWEKRPDVEPQTITIEKDGTGVACENGLMRIRMEANLGKGPVEIVDKIAERSLVRRDDAQPCVKITVNDAVIGGEALRVVRSSAAGAGVEIVLDVLPCPGVQLTVRIDWTAEGALRFRGRLANNGSVMHCIGITAPQIGPYVLGGDLADNEYVYPCRAAIIGRDAVNLSERYSGLFNVQFMATANPRAGQGLYLRTEDATCIERNYVLSKEAQGMTMAVSYPARPLAPGEVRPLADTIIAISDGDWHVALADYRRWLATWYRPVSPRKAWFREVFNFRQRFLHWLDPLYDANTGVIDLPRAIAEAQAQFGGIDYLHLFDWGNCGPYGRIYGRVGDYSPYDYLKGGLPNLHDGIAHVREGGTPAGLYIEGYLLDERGKLGQAHGPAWQLRTADGQGARWPNSTELFICPGVEEWRKIQAATYAEKVRELDVDGMYIDEFGFTGHDKDCHSGEHGHPVPSYPVTTECETTRATRDAVDAVKPGVAIYTEESPCDVTTQYQDGSFTYAMNQVQARGGTIPLNMTRFAFPDFKTFEILICDQPTGSWATGVEWAFFNGEGIWLEGPANQWFAPETLAVIRKCHAILREHRDAFTTGHPLPLVPTLAGGVWANHFPIEQKEVWTLYNTRRRSFSGRLLRVPHRSGWTWHNAWRNGPPEMIQEGAFDVVIDTLGPQEAGCVVRVNALRCYSLRGPNGNQH